ncbi:hypothetical protein T439DRAFT_376126 [Meredithblackwellia eburnea MCA 4105]
MTTSRCRSLMQQQQQASSSKTSLGQSKCTAPPTTQPIPQQSDSSTATVPYQNLVNLRPESWPRGSQTPKLEDAVAKEEEEGQDEQEEGEEHTCCVTGGPLTPESNCSPMELEGIQGLALLLAASQPQPNREYHLEVVQQPQRARMCGHGDKDRRPITPPLIVKLICRDSKTGEAIPVDDVDTSFFIMSADLRTDDLHDANVIQHVGGNFASNSLRHHSPGTRRSSFNNHHHRSHSRSISSSTSSSHSHMDKSSAASPEASTSAALSQHGSPPSHHAFPTKRSVSPPPYMPPPPPTMIPSVLLKPPGFTTTQQQPDGQQPPRILGSGLVAAAAGSPPTSSHYGESTPSSSRGQSPNLLSPTSSYANLSSHHHHHHHHPHQHNSTTSASMPTGHGGGSKRRRISHGDLNATKFIIPYSRDGGEGRRDVESSSVHGHIVDEHDDDEEEEEEGSDDAMQLPNLIGSLHTNAFKLKDEGGEPGIFFFWPDLSVRTEGRYKLRLRFLSIGMGGSRINGSAPVVASTYSNAFTVSSAKKFEGMLDPTSMSKNFAKQGIRIPTRKVKSRKKRGAPGAGAELDELEDDDE